MANSLIAFPNLHLIINELTLLFFNRIYQLFGYAESDKTFITNVINNLNFNDNFKQLLLSNENNMVKLILFYKYIKRNKKRLDLVSYWLIRGGLAQIYLLYLLSGKIIFDPLVYHSFNYGIDRSFIFPGYEKILIKAPKNGRTTTRI